jgi:hypothetical protein
MKTVHRLLKNHVSTSRIRREITMSRPRLLTELIQSTDFGGYATIQRIIFQSKLTKFVECTNLSGDRTNEPNVR